MSSREEIIEDIKEFKEMLESDLEIAYDNSLRGLLKNQIKDLDEMIERWEK